VTTEDLIKAAIRWAVLTQRHDDLTDQPDGLNYEEWDDLKGKVAAAQTGAELDLLDHALGYRQSNPTDPVECDHYYLDNPDKKGQTCLICGDVRSLEAANWDDAT
jgi:hypothetical protein